MIYKTEADFAAKLKNYNPCNVYFLYGEQNYLKKMYLKKIIDKTVDKAFADFNLNRFDGTSASLDDISDAVEALPMMAPRKCVVVNDLDVGKLTATDNNKLKELLASPPESTVLVFTTTDVMVDMKKSAKWKAFVKLVDAVGDVIELGARSPSDTNRFLKVIADKNGCTISSDNCYYLIERCGDDMQVLQNEMNKLCAYKSTGEITKADIDLCAVAVLDASVFDLSKLIIKGDYQGAMQNLSELLYLREEPVMILGALSASFIDLYRARVARENSKTAADLSRIFGAYKGKDWRVRNAMRDCDRFGKAQLGSILELLAKADYKLKSSKTDNVIILQETITRIFAVGNARR
ncbi:DNA polymerase III subunit delta [Hydrogenoanaerobacterium sp.]|uniref:DNA polymerase III subunit delta n=1 Tax=Hydrogenoanaerobacterium sp. TaxID=2953763 RepID=UPI0028A1CEA6|nr:DNA polymerase III subunit delta [Hydrogenoanaerobacterium sp.]